MQTRLSRRLTRRRRHQGLPWRSRRQRSVAAGDLL